MYKRLVIAIPSALIMAGCGAAPTDTISGDQPTQETTQSLFIPTGKQIWNTTIPICFTQLPALLNDHSREKKIIKDAIQNTWLRVAAISSTWTDVCPTTGSATQLRINLGAHTASDGVADGQASGWGMETATVASTPINADNFQNPGIRLWIQDDGGSTQSYIELAAIHEFGHVLGFGHEEDRSDAPTSCNGGNWTGSNYGPFDPDSIMNTNLGCNDGAHGYLSEGDISSVRMVYGFAPALGNFAADVSGDGKADAIAVTSDGNYVMLSDGTQFTWSGLWSSAFYGSRETLFADVNGDGKADAIAINNGGNYVMLSDGTQFTWSGQWSNPFYGTRKTLAGDVNGDGKADLIAVNWEGLFVMLSTGTGFSWAGQWSGPFFGGRGTFIGNVDGDSGHKADIVKIDQAGWSVALSTGSAIVPQWGATGTYSSNARALAIADANNDGKDDLVALNDWGINVSLSQGTFGFGAVAFSSGPFFGDRTSLLADVNGDHKIDAIAVTTTGQNVLTSTGSSFTGGGQWSAAFLSYPYPH